MRAILLFLFFAAGTLCAQPFEDFFSKTEAFQRAHIGICLLDGADGHVIYERNPDQFFTPASVQKICTTIAALSLLKEDFVFTTRLEYEGTIDSSKTLHGNLWIVGGGDPTLSISAISLWEEAIKKAGIERVDGKIIADASAFEKFLASGSWNWEDTGNDYGAGACGLSINENCYTIAFREGQKEGTKAIIDKIYPKISGLHIHNEITYGPKESKDNVCIYGVEYYKHQFLRGTLSLEKQPQEIKGAIYDPALFCAKSLSQRIPATKGVRVVREKSKHRPRTLLVTISSPPLKEMIKRMNQESINLYAESLFKTLGGGSYKEAQKRVESFFQSYSMPCNLKDGSGLARVDFLTPKGLANLLYAVQKESFFPLLYESLAETQKEGTLKTFPKIEGACVEAKTGTMSHVCNLAGYITEGGLDSRIDSKAGKRKRLIFVIFCNNYPGENQEVKKEMHRFLSSLIVQPKNTEAKRQESKTL